MFTILMAFTAAEARTCTADKPVVTYNFTNGVVTDETKLGDPFGEASLVVDGKTLMDWNDRFRCMLTPGETACEGYKAFPLHVQTLAHEASVVSKNKDGSATTKWTETVRLSRADGQPIRDTEEALEVTWHCEDARRKEKD